MVILSSKRPDAEANRCGRFAHFGRRAFIAQLRTPSTVILSAAGRFAREPACGVEGPLRWFAQLQSFQGVLIKISFRLR